MITKGTVEEIIGYKAKVRLPIFDGKANTRGSTKQADLTTATICSLVGVTYPVSVGDVVWVGFEDNDVSKPIILGSLYRKNGNIINSAIEVAGLNVKTVATLPEDTYIGKVRPYEVQMLTGVKSNLQLQLNNIYETVDKINTEKARLIIDEDGIARAGEINHEVPIALRDETKNLHHNGVIVWDQQYGLLRNFGSVTATDNILNIGSWALKFDVEDGALDFRYRATYLSDYSVEKFTDEYDLYPQNADILRYTPIDDNGNVVEEYRATGWMVGDNSQDSGNGLINTQKWYNHSYNKDTKQYVSDPNEEANHRILIIPPMYRGKPVTKIGLFAFADTIIEQVAIPSTIKFIDNFAFFNTYELRYMFINSNDFETPQLSDDSSILYTFINSGKVNELVVEFGENITKIPTQLFVSMADTTDAVNSGLYFKVYKVILNNVREIGHAAFAACADLRYIDCTNVTSVDRQAFHTCVNLFDLALPNAMEVNSDAFIHCINLRCLYLNSTCEFTANNTNYSGKCLFYNCPSFENIYFNGSIISSLDGAVAYNSSTGVERAITLNPNTTAATYNSLSINKTILPSSTDYVESLVKDANVGESIEFDLNAGLQSNSGYMTASVSSNQSSTLILNFNFKFASRTVNLVQGINKIPYAIYDLRILGYDSNNTLILSTSSNPLYSAFTHNITNDLANLKVTLTATNPNISTSWEQGVSNCARYVLTMRYVVRQITVESTVVSELVDNKIRV